MKCPECTERFERNIRIRLRTTRTFYQDKLSPTMMRMGDVEVDAKIYVEQEREVTRTIFDSEWFCPACGEQIETEVVDEQVILNEL